MFRKYLTIASVCFFISCKIKSPDEYLKEASQLENRGKLKEAIVLLNEAIDKNPKYLPAYINRGVDQSMLGNYILAIRDYSTVIELSPGNVLALVNRGRNETRIGRYRKALEDFQMAINAKGGEQVHIDATPNQWVDIASGYDCPMAEICLERGLAYYNLDSLNKAYHDFQFYISKQYALGTAYRLRGYVYIASQKKELGCKDLQKAAAMGDEEANEAEKRYCR